VLAIAILFVLANLVADLTYQIVDPRIRVRSGGNT
jgi:ABC-type dipeptide/oligopeptide/nickel transport system permease component